MRDEGGCVRGYIHPSCRRGRGNEGVGYRRGGRSTAVDSSSSSTRTGVRATRVNPRVKVRAPRDLDIHRRVIRSVIPSITRIRGMRDVLPTGSRDRAGGERLDGTRRRIREHVGDSITTADRGWGPPVLRSDRGGDVASASATSLPGLEGRSPGANVPAGTIGITGVFRHPAVLETELVRPGGGFDDARLGGVANFPGPEEVVLQEGRLGMLRSE